MGDQEREVRGALIFEEHLVFVWAQADGQNLCFVISGPEEENRDFDLGYRTVTSACTTPDQQH
jgi:hypothetical protein